MQRAGQGGERGHQLVRVPGAQARGRLAGTDLDGHVVVGEHRERVLVGHVVARVDDDACAQLVAQRAQRLALARVQHRDLHDVLAVQHARTELLPQREGLRLGGARVVCGTVRETFGPRPAPPLVERGALFVAFSIALFLADDLSRYLVHRLMHRVPALWELHKVHHSAEVLTPLTLYRVHPIESWLNRLRGALSAGLVTGLFMWAFPGKLRAFEVLGVDALGFVWTALGANLRHSHVWLGFPAWAERWVISPAQHQMHHARSSSAPPGNYGSALALWDRMFGTLSLSEGRRPMRVGLPRSERNHSPSAVSMLVMPVWSALRVLSRSSRATGPHLSGRPSPSVLDPMHGSSE